MDTFGTFFKVTLFGESHGPAVGAVIDGVPPGLPIEAGDFARAILRRKTGTGKTGVSARQEDDIPEILGGVYNGCTTGAPLAVMFRNRGQRPEDYEALEQIPRPGHADFTASVKYNYFNDPRGGGHFSGRLTLPLVAAGVVALKALEAVVAGKGDVSMPALRPAIHAEVVEIGGESGKEGMERIIGDCVASGDSVGGIVECRAVFAIPGIRGIEFGDGFNAARMRGSEHNDPFIDSSGHTSKNGSGGINGGISNGNEICFRVAVKPPSSIAKAQETFDFVNDRMTVLETGGRHDACIALRIPPVLEAVTAIVLADLVMAAGCR